MVEKGYILLHQQHQPKQPKSKKLRWLMYAIFVCLCIPVLFSYFRKYWTSPFQVQMLYPPPPASKHQPAEHQPAEHHPTERQPTERPKEETPKYCGGIKTVPRERSAALEKVHGTKTVLIAAYREHRNPGREVRVLAIVKRSELDVYHCIFCCQDKLHTSVASYSIHTDHFGFTYGTGDIMCPLPFGCESPSHVTVTKHAASKASLDEPQSLSEVFLEVKDREERRDPFPYNFTVCISTMFNFDNVLQLVQTLEMYQLLGANKVAIYRETCNSETQTVLDYYTKKGLVDVIPWNLKEFLQVSQNWKPERGPGELHYHGQIPALNDCLYRYMYQSRYLAMNDIDEIIMPQSLNSWMELLPALEDEHNAVGCFQFENNVFPTTITWPPPSPGILPPESSYWNRWEKVTGVNILTHLYSEPVPHQYNFKIIINPRLVYSVSVHGVLNSIKSCSWVKKETAQLHHIRAPNQPDLPKSKLIYNNRILSYSKRLTLTVDEALRESGFLPKDSKQ